MTWLLFLILLLMAADGVLRARRQRGLVDRAAAVLPTPYSRWCAALLYFAMSGALLLGAIPMWRS